MLRTMERTIIDKIGRGFVYTSPEDCIIVGMGARPEVDVGISGSLLSSAPLFHQVRKVGLCRLLQNDMGLATRRIQLGCSSRVSKILDSCTPNDLLSGAEELILNKRTESCEEIRIAILNKLRNSLWHKSVYLCMLCKEKSSKHMYILQIITFKFNRSRRLRNVRTNISHLLLYLLRHQAPSLPSAVQLRHYALANDRLCRHVRHCEPRSSEVIHCKLTSWSTRIRSHPSLFEVGSCLIRGTRSQGRGF